MDVDTESALVHALRWAASLVVVLAGYAVISGFLLFRPAPPADQGGGESAIEIDLQPATAPEQTRVAPPGPPQSQPESEARPDAQALPERPSEPENQVQPADQDQPDKPMKAAPEKTEVAPPPPTEQPSDASLPTPEAPPPPRAATQAPPPQAAAPPPSAPETVEAAPGPARPSPPGQSDKPPSRAVLTWERLLVSRLERAKRYPPQADGRQGATTVSFTIDRSGRLLASRIVRGSGSPVFDEATLDLLSRSQPLPTPPDKLDDRQLSFVVTIHYAR